MIPLRAFNPRLFIAKLYHGIIDDDTGARLSFVPAVFNLDPQGNPSFPINDIRYKDIKIIPLT